MDNPDDDTAPAAFIAAAGRWARGQGTPLDHAAVAAVSLHKPVPPIHDIRNLGFDIATRLPAPNRLHAYGSARDAARALAHAETSRAARAAVLRAATCAAPPPTDPALGARASGTGAAAGAALLFRASLSARDASWTVNADQLLPAGGGLFVRALRARGCDISADAERGGVLEISAARPSATELLRAYFAAAALRGDALPAGELHAGGMPAGWRRKAAGVVCDAFGALGTFAARVGKRPRRARRSKR